MNISNVVVRLTEDDLLGMIKENIEEEGLEISKIKIDNSLNIYGSYNKKIKIGFKAAVAFAGAVDNILSVKICSAKVGVIPICMPLINLVLKKGLANTDSVGIGFEDGLLKIDFNKMSRMIPQVDFIIKHIFLFNNIMELELNKIVYSEDKKAMTLDELKKELLNGNSSDNGDKINSNEEESSDSNDDKEKDNIKDKNTNNKNEAYQKIRVEFKDKTPEKYKKITKYVLIIPDIIVLLYRLIKDERINLKTRAMIGGLITYLALPIDIIPDAIPILGQIDDVAIVFIVLEKILKNLDKEIVFDNWQGDDDIIAKVREGSKYISAFLGKDKAIKIIKTVFSIRKKKRRR
ncbi:DUF1232 domain-containing protein [Clostridium sediminicola]|uniref:YkvA family protein n=1 Tax=Clostridium sediminicola TaxID=3114879 RepID=UPI0031F1EBE6